MDNDKIQVLIEIPEGSRLKYELDETNGTMVLDRIMPTAMSYPANYGLIENTRGEDGDALDAFVFTSQPLLNNTLVKCKVIGLLEMEDEGGGDNKIIAVPDGAKIDPICGTWDSLADIPQAKKDQVRHFLEHYKDLEPEKWVKLKNWQPKEKALEVLQQAQHRKQK